MLVKVCNQLVIPKPFLISTAQKQERRIVPVNTSEFRYLRFRAIGCMEWPFAGPNGNFDGFLYEDFEDDTPGFGYRSFVGKKAHAEHNSQLGIAGSIGDLPDAYLNSFLIPDDVKIKKWAEFKGKQNGQTRLKVLSFPNQRDGSIEVLMRVDTKLVKSAEVKPKVRSLLDRIVRMIDTGQQLTCSMGCFVPGTGILFPNGEYRSIENIRNGDRIVTHMGNSGTVIETLVRNFDGSLVNIFVWGEQKELSVTPNHPVLAKKVRPLCACGCGKRVIKKAGTWSGGHFARVFNSNKKYSLEYITEKKLEIAELQTEELDWVVAEDLQVGDLVAYPISQEELPVSHITPGKAKLIGYFLAEGSYLKYANKEGEKYKTAAVFSLGNTEKDQPLIKEIVELCKQEWPEVDPKLYISKKYATKDERAIKKYGAAYKGCIEIRLHNRAIAQFFEYYCNEYAHTKKLPQEVMTWSKILQKYLIAGYFNGDGDQHVRNGTQQTKMCTVSEVLAYQILYLLRRVGVPSGLYRGEWEYLPSPIYSVYVRGKWQNVLSELWIYPPTADYIESLSKYRIENSFILVPIKKIERNYYKGPVYNLEVKDTHSYVAHGVIVHNSNIAYSFCSSCGNKAQFSNEYCNCLKKRKGSLSIVPANQLRDLLDKDILREEWLKHTLASVYDINEVVNGNSNKPVASKNIELNHKVSFFELSIVAVPAYSEAKLLEKIARKQQETKKEYLARIAKEFGEDSVLDLYSYLQERGKISNQCSVQ